jgi:glycerophosphoryl diester phosphodiesterase
MSKPVTTYAHRGARGHAPENTLLAFSLAFDLGAEAIEFDGAMNLEVKADSREDALATAATLEGVLADLNEPVRARILVSSFELDAVAWLKSRLPWLRVGTLFTGSQWRKEDMIARALDLDAEAIHPNIRLVVSDLVERAHDVGLRVNVWTANRWPTIRRLLAFGVDGIFSDLPERVVIERARFTAREMA